ncbi:MAG: hypothetical protein K0V04_34750 [Deltaproteobacteria bacterium]|nr:hypothetical protein [Deltaproteobacteria bacterium]
MSNSKLYCLQDGARTLIEYASFGASSGTALTVPTLQSGDRFSEGWAVADGALCVAADGDAIQKYRRSGDGFVADFPATTTSRC